MIEMMEGQVDEKDTASLRKFCRCSRLGDTSGITSNGKSLTLIDRYITFYPLVSINRA